MRRLRSRLGWALAGLVIVVYTLVPVVWIVSLSFKEGDNINNRQFFPTSWSLENYRTVFDTSLFTSALRRTRSASPSSRRDCR